MHRRVLLLAQATSPNALAASTMPQDSLERHAAGTNRYVKQLWGPVNKDVLQKSGAKPSPPLFKDEGDDGQQWWSGMLEHGDAMHNATPASSLLGVVQNGSFEDDQDPTSFEEIFDLLVGAEQLHAMRRQHQRQELHAAPFSSNRRKLVQGEEDHGIDFKTVGDERRPGLLQPISASVLMQ